MNKLFLYLIFTLISVFGDAQLTKIPVNLVHSQQAKGLKCLDSSGRVTDFCSSGLDGFLITLFSAYIDNNNRQLQIVGRVCPLGSDDSPGVSDIEIFKATNEGDKIINRIRIGESTHGREFINNDGFFDVTISILEKESIFFYGTKYFVKEFEVYKLFK